MNMKTTLVVCIFAGLSCVYSACGGDGDGSSADTACDHLIDCLQGCGLSSATCSGYNSPDCNSCIASTECSEHCSFFGDPVNQTWACEDVCDGGRRSSADAGTDTVSDQDASTQDSAGGDPCNDCIASCTDGGTPQSQCTIDCLPQCDVNLCNRCLSACSAEGIPQTQCTINCLPVCT